MQKREIINNYLLMKESIEVFQRAVNRQFAQLNAHIDMQLNELVPPKDPPKRRSKGEWKKEVAEW